MVLEPTDNHYNRYQPLRKEEYRSYLEKNMTTENENCRRVANFAIKFFSAPFRGV